MIILKCDLCSNIKECFQKEIDGREYDVCSECWTPLEDKLKGKGRAKRARETIFLPEHKEPESEKPKPLPGRRPEIWSAGVPD